MGSLPEERDAYLGRHVEPGEAVLATGPPALVTDRRILFAWRLNWPPHVAEWAHDAIVFDEITEWSEGRRHDERPILRIQHPPHVRLGWAPAHRVLWFRWGNRAAPTSHSRTEFMFRGRRDPVFVATHRQLLSTSAVQGDPFRERLSGTREERLGSGVRVLQYRRSRFPALHRLRRRLRSTDEWLHHGRIHWWIRLGSWAIIAVPMWFVSPWLVVPAIVAVEIAWIIGLEWSWRRERSRRRETLPSQPSPVE